MLAILLIDAVNNRNIKYRRSDLHEGNHEKEDITAASLHQQTRTMADRNDFSNHHIELAFTLYFSFFIIAAFTKIDPSSFVCLTQLYVW